MATSKGAKLGPATTNLTAVHPGEYVRQHALKPKGITVTEASKVLGVSRPGVSNFLNGKVSTTSDMAARIERAFGIPATTLLEMQSAFDAAQAKRKGAPPNTKAYVPPFLRIRANDIQEWADKNIPARSRFAVLLRTLVNSTGQDSSKVDFPGNDDSERPGWDGYVETSHGTPWIPEGISGWEFGVNASVTSKADSDFAKSVKASDARARAGITFVFVTPRRWPGKAAWADTMRAKKLWRDVRAYDSSDLEQWFEQSLAAQTWFSNETDRPSEGVRSLDQCWADWAGVTKPELSPDLLRSAVEIGKRKLASRFLRQPDGPILIAADSAQEALAFLSELFRTENSEELAPLRDRILVFDRPGVVPRLAKGAQNFIAVTTSRDVEREFAAISRSMHTVIVYPRNAAGSDPEVILEPATYDVFRAGLEKMGCSRDDIQRLDQASGRSLTVLRRQLSTVPVIKNPQWAGDHAVASPLIPFLFVGAWNSANEADRTALSLLGNKTYEELEKTLQSATLLDDAPVWSVGSYRGVVSKIDLLYAISATVTEAEIRSYLDLARLVLSEDDPSLDLPESERWAASFHGKSREFSAALRNGVSESLVLLAVRGNALFKQRLGLDSEVSAARLVSELLEPLSLRTLEANGRDLPTYAEAAPDQFLSIIEKDLRTDNPVVVGLMRPAEAGLFGGGCPRTGLLWALEGLAWSPETLSRTALILARLSEIEINDNWANKPIASLQSIFRTWMPQTAASHDQRLAVFKLIRRKHPRIAWKLCMEEINVGQRVGDYTHKPRWRTDGYGFGEPFTTWDPVIAFMRELLKTVFEWSSYDGAMICDLIQHLPDFHVSEHDKVWDIVEGWVAAGASDQEKATVREKIRVTALSRRATRRAKSTGKTIPADRAQAIIASLEPTDLLSKHEWLFANTWVEESADELEEEELDYRKREDRIAKLRADALWEVFEQRGLEGIIELASRGKAASQIGWHLSKDVLQPNDIPPLLAVAAASLIPGSDPAGPSSNLIAGALRVTPSDQMKGLLGALREIASPEQLIQILCLAPPRRAIWEVVDDLPHEEQSRYWKEASVDWFQDSDDEQNELVERLLAAGRPRAAFWSVHFHPEKLPPRTLFRLLSDMTTSEEPSGHYQMQQHDLERAFDALNKMSDVTLEEKAGLEFRYIEVLARPWSRREGYGIPNLERFLEKNPHAYVQALVWTYKRKDGGEDPPEFKVAAENANSLSTRGFKLLHGIGRIPGHNTEGVPDSDTLAIWVTSVRDAAAGLGRLEVADLLLGELFSNAPVGDDGVWPCEPVRQLMEDVQSTRISDGAQTGVYNSRGVHGRGDGGEQERELADRYRAWAQALQYSNPFVSSTLLMGLVRTYEQEAGREDTEAGIRRRLH